MSTVTRNARMPVADHDAIVSKSLKESLLHGVRGAFLVSSMKR
jgi:hypothetical protein